MNQPRISDSACLLPGAVAMGDVVVGDLACLWYNTVARADTASIAIGARTNVQDGTVLHGDCGHPVKIGENVTIGHACIIHGCTVGDGSLVGMGSILMNDAKVGRGCIIGAGSLLTMGTEVPDGTLAMGRPAKVVRVLTEEERAELIEFSLEYVELARLAQAHPEAQVPGGQISCD